MTPFWSDDHLTLYGGDCRDVLAELPAESVHCVVTSPPYWGLRDYGSDGQLGLEPTPEAYVANMVAVLREVRRVLRDDGTLWLNLGDSYWSDTLARKDPVESMWGNRPASDLSAGRDAIPKGNARGGLGARPPGLKPKDLVGIPWRVAFALQADGWYLRSDIIWSKPNPMPESVTDRPTKAHEYLFLLSKSPRYYFDAVAVREADAGLPSGNGFAGRQGGARQSAVDGGDGSPERFVPGAGRNLRSVWTIATEPYPGAHFATFPRKLVEPCVKAGTSERGVCPECGAPWVRVVEREFVKTPGDAHVTDHVDATGYDAGSNLTHPLGYGRYDVTTKGWFPSCDRYGHLIHTGPDGRVLEPVPAVVLDPFAGSGTTLLVAQALGRRGVGIDLSPDYLRQALERNAQTPLGL